MNIDGDIFYHRYSQGIVTLNIDGEISCAQDGVHYMRKTVCKHAQHGVQ